MNVANVNFYFIVINTFFIGYQTSKLVITQTRSQWIHRVSSGASFKMSKKSSVEYPHVQFLKDE